SPPEMDGQRDREATLKDLEFTKNHPKQSLGGYAFFDKHGNIRLLSLLGSQPCAWQFTLTTFPGWI
ncbi:hypothetical protein, partial [Pseudomonas syringae]|uniref:hypothetical protein n=1 Tax=Pseudomonas syringae TaxID=317 RepID=UPI001C557538